MKKVLIALSLLALSGCTDADRAQIAGFGNKYRITLYSGGEPVRTWVSTGKVHAETQSDGWFFMDAATGRLVRMFGDSVVEQID